MADAEDSRLLIMRLRSALEDALLLVEDGRDRLARRYRGTLDRKRARLHQRAAAVGVRPYYSAAPHREDAVAQWLKSGRDQYQPGTNHYQAMDLLLDDYRLHIDTGTPLDQHACDGPYCCTDRPGRL